MAYIRSYSWNFFPGPQFADRKINFFSEYSASLCRTRLIPLEIIQVYTNSQQQVTEMRFLNIERLDAVFRYIRESRQLAKVDN